MTTCETTLREQWELASWIATTVGSIVVTIGFVAIIYQIYLQRKQTKISNESNIFSVFVRVHEIISNESSRRVRKYLYDDFTAHLVTTTREVLGQEYITTVSGKEKINIGIVLSNLPEDDLKRSVFNNKLNSITVNIGDIHTNALEAVESTLSDFDFIAISAYSRLDPAKKVAKVYGSIFLATASVVLPFVLIQKKLRGEGDPLHRIPYLYLFKETVTLYRKVIRKRLDIEETLLEQILRWIELELKKTEL